MDSSHDNRASEWARPLRSLCWIAVALSLGLMSSGCMGHVKSNVAPGTNLKDPQTFYVLQTPDNDRGMAQTIADQFHALGLKATAGDKANTPSDVDALVTFTDRWMWDITMYLLQLNITITDARTGLPLATGESMHTSFERQPPPVMAREILDSIFKNGASAATSAGRS